jgi:predicted metal-dependent phosphotriesterase family hydrolase
MTSGKVTTVLGDIEPDALGVFDAHGHAWIEPVPGARTPGFVLADYGLILAELHAFRGAGGGAIADCQPGGCGRNGNILAKLSGASGVAIVACTGFHRSLYYAPDNPILRLDEDSAAQQFVIELRDGLLETRNHPGTAPVRAGFVKAACEAKLADTSQALLRGAALGARQTGAAFAVHTERGQAADEVVHFLESLGVDLRRVILFHMDKRPDFGLHRELAQTGILLEYDTFLRPKYDPEANLWPLIERMAGAGLEGSVALATDMADPALWAQRGAGRALTALPENIRARLHKLGLPPTSVEKMLGANAARRLAGAVAT